MNLFRYSAKQNFLFLLLVIVTAMNGQESKVIDSLKLALNYSTNDTMRCRILSKLINIEPDFKVWPKYNNMLLKLTESKLKDINQPKEVNKLYKEYYAEALYNEGDLAMIQGDISRSQDNFIRSMKEFEDLGDKNNVSYSIMKIGNTYWLQGLFPKAFECLNRSLKIFEELGDKYGIVLVLKLYGEIYYYQGSYDEALKYYFKCLKICEENEFEIVSGSILTNIGMAYLKKEIRQKALFFFDKSLKKSEELNDYRGVSIALNNIGLFYLDKNKVESKEDTIKKDLLKSIEYFDRSLKISEDIEDNGRMAVVNYNLGMAYFKLKNIQKAASYAEKAMEISKQSKIPENLKNSTKLLYLINKTNNNFKVALEYHELYIQMRDSVNNIETQKSAIRQQANYEYQKKQDLANEKHKGELKVQEEKAQAEKKKQYIIIGSVSIVLLMVGLFSFILFNRFRIIRNQKSLIEIKEKETQTQKHVIEEKQKEILDSINYAKRIQYTLLAHDQFLNDNIPDHFVYFNPKDIVSGDFYWATKVDSRFYLAICDSTGHGIPGAFMSLLNIGFLSEAINEKDITSPDKVFDYVRMKLTGTISRDGQKDGFDGILVCFDQASKQITYAAANNSPVLINNGSFIELPADRMPVGLGERKENFSLFSIDAKPGDVLYLYTDGYADQFGGPKGKKFKYKQLNELLVEIHSKSTSEQQEALKHTFDEWKGNLEQVDDVCVIGIRIS